MIDEIVDTWKAEQHRRQIYLEYVHMDNELEIYDGRVLPEKIVHFDERTSRVLLLCSEPVSIGVLSSKVKDEMGSEELQQILSNLTKQGLVFQEETSIISLVLPRQTSEESQLPGPGIVILNPVVKTTKDGN